MEISHSAEHTDLVAKVQEKGVVSTGQAVKLLNGAISQQTVIRAFDAQQLNGFLVPGSSFRRIPLREFVRWVKESGMESQLPPSLLAKPHDVTLYTTDEIRNAISGLLPEERIQHFDNSFEFGSHLKEYADIVVVDEATGQASTELIASQIRQRRDDVTLVGILKNGVHRKTDYHVQLDEREPPENIATMVGKIVRPSSEK